MAAARRSRLSTDVRREQLVALGIEIFSDRPFDEVSIDDIAAAAGISKGLLYHYFPSKRDFYVAVIRSAADEMQALTEPDPALAPRERLAAALERYLEYVETHARGYADGAARRHRQRPGGGAHRRGGARRDGRAVARRPPRAAGAPRRRPRCGSRSAAGSGSSRPRASTGSSTAASGARTCAVLVAALGGAVSAAAGADPRVRPEPVAL